MVSKLNDEDERMRKDDKVGADGLGQSRRISTLQQYFPRSVDLVSMQTMIQFCRENLRFCISNKFPVNVATAGLRMIRL